MCNEAYESYVAKCALFEVNPTSREQLERNENIVDVVKDQGGMYISVSKAKEFAKRAYALGYKEAMREMAS